MELDNIRDTICEIKNRVNEHLFDRDALKSKLESLECDRDEANDNHMSAKEVQLILQKVARETQSEIEDHLSKVVTLALSAVEVDSPDIPAPPEFVVRMVERRDSTECDLLFKEGDREQYPTESGGFGYCDIADYALRIDYLLLKEEYTEEGVRRVLISDEPFRNVDPKLQNKVSSMLEMFSKELGFQQFIVSHAKGINADAETTFKVKKIGKLSHVTTTVA